MIIFVRAVFHENDKNLSTSFLTQTWTQGLSRTLKKQNIFINYHRIIDS